MWGYVTGQDFDHLEAMGPQITYLLLAGEEIRKLRKELRRSSRDPRDPRDPKYSRDPGDGMVDESVRSWSRLSPEGIHHESPCFSEAF